MKILIKNKRSSLKLLTDEVDFRAKNIAIDKVGNEIMMKGSIHQKVIHPKCGRIKQQSQNSKSKIL